MASDTGSVKKLRPKIPSPIASNASSRLSRAEHNASVDTKLQLERQLYELQQTISTLGLDKSASERDTSVNLSTSPLDQRTKNSENSSPVSLAEIRWSEEKDRSPPSANELKDDSEIANLSMLHALVKLTTAVTPEKGNVMVNSERTSFSVSHERSEPVFSSSPRNGEPAGSDTSGRASLHSQLAAAISQAREAESKLGRLQSHVGSLERENSNLLAYQEDLESRCVKLEKRLKESEVENENLRRSKDLESNDFENLRRTIEPLKNKIENQQATIARQDEALDMLRKEIDKDRERRDAVLQERTEEVAHLLKILKDRDEQIEMLGSTTNAVRDLNDLSGIPEALAAQLRQAEMVIEELRQQLKAAQLDNSEKEKRAERLMGQLEANNQLHKAQQMLSERRQSECERQLGAKSQQLEDTRKHSVKLASRIALLESIAQSKREGVVSPTSQRDNADMEDSLVFLRNHSALLVAQLLEKEGQCESLQSELRALYSSRRRAEEELDNMKSTQAPSAVDRDLLSQFQSEIARLEALLHHRETQLLAAHRQLGVGDFSSLAISEEEMRLQLINEESHARSSARNLVATGAHLDEVENELIAAHSRLANQDRTIREQGKQIHAQKLELESLEETVRELRPDQPAQHGIVPPSAASLKFERAKETSDASPAVQHVPFISGGENAVAKLEAQRDLLEHEVQLLKKQSEHQNSKWSDIVSRFESTVESLERDRAELTTEIARLTASHSGLDDSENVSLAALNSENIRLRREILMLQKSVPGAGLLEEYTAAIESLERDKERMMKDIVLLSGQFEHVRQRDVDLTRGDGEATSERINQLEKTIADLTLQLTNALDDTDNALRTRDSYIASIEDHNQKLTRNLEASGLLERNIELEKALDEALEESRHLAVDLDNAHLVSDTNRALLAAAEKKITELKQELQAKDIETTTLENKIIIELQEEVGRLSGVVRIMEAEAEHLVHTPTPRAHSPFDDARHSLQRDVEAKEISMLRSEVKVLQSALSDAQSNLSFLTTEIQHREDHLDSLTSLLGQYTGPSDGGGSRGPAVDPSNSVASSQEINEVTRRMKMYQSELQMYKQSSGELVATLRHQLSQTIAQNAILTQQLKEASGASTVEITELDHLRETLAQVRSELNVVVANRDSLTDSNKRFQSQIRALEAENLRLLTT